MKYKETHQSCMLQIYTFLEKNIKWPTIITALVLSFIASAFGGVWTLYNVIAKLPPIVEANANWIENTGKNIPSTYVRKETYEQDVKDIKVSLGKLYDLHLKGVK